MGWLPGNPRFYTYVDGEFSFEKYMSAMQAGHTFVAAEALSSTRDLTAGWPGIHHFMPEGMTLEPVVHCSHQSRLRHARPRRSGTQRRHRQGVQATQTRATEMTGSGRIPIDESCWVAVRIYGKKSKGRGGPSYLQYRSAAHTTPFYVEVGGKAFWKRSELPAGT